MPSCQRISGNVQSSAVFALWFANYDPARLASAFGDVGQRNAVIPPGFQR
jgi:hypothetical protein